ncbi:Gfo/Idh/MocA family oxidoreductase [Leucobacter sp. gxy201]|uniref:Gfo/Idh/MocA family protein n=1 Tax=Leucobacter sp. gxy201 TaxID=2957200 RepID=UPI003DA0337A
MRIGLVGYGAGGRIFHLPFIQAAPEWEIVGVVTRSAGRRAELAADVPGLRAFDSLDDLIDAGVDAVVITTPPSTRRELVLRALERGVHVVADKPFAPDLATAQELVDAAAAAGTCLTVFHNRRQDTDFLTLRAVVASGEIGTPMRADFVLDQADPASREIAVGGGLLRDLGAHVVDQATQLFGPVARVDAHLDWLDVPGGRVDCGFSIALHHESGAFSQVSSSRLGLRDERGMIVYGSEGSYASRMHDVQVDQTFAGLRPNTAEDWGVEAEERWGTLATAAGSRRIAPVAGDYTDYYRGLHAALAAGEEPPVRLAEALHTVAILDAARESDELGCSVEL